MIYEREVHFTDLEFDNPKYFPDILIVRKKKFQESSQKNTQSVSELVRTQFKEVQEQLIDKMGNKFRDQKLHLTN